MFVGWITNSFSGSRLAGPTRCVETHAAWLSREPAHAAWESSPRAAGCMLWPPRCGPEPACAWLTTGQSTNDLAPPQLPADLCPGWKDGLPGRDPVSVDPGKVSEAQGQAPGLGSSRLLVF